MRLIQIICLISILCLSVNVSNAGTITLSGSDLFNNANSTFPTRTPNLNGTEINFGAGTNQYEALLDYSWIEENALEAGDTLSVAVTMRRSTTDFDPYFLISDGTNAFGAGAADNNSGTGLSAHFSHGSTITQAAGFSSLFNNAGFPSIGDLFTVNLDIILQDSTTDMTFSYSSGNGNHIFNTGLDRSQSLRLLIAGDNAGEQYGITEITLTSPESAVVPEPSTFALILTGLFGLGAIRRKRKLKRASNMLRRMVFNASVSK